MVYDQFSDTYHVILKSLFDEGVLPDFTKSASILDRSEQGELGRTAFADQINRRFPVHTPEHTLISAGYFFKQSCHETEPRVVRDRLAKAAYAHEVETEFLGIARQLASGDRVPLEKRAESYNLLVERHGKLHGKFFTPNIPMLKEAEAHFVGNYRKYPITWRVETCQNLIKQAQRMGVNEMHPVIHAYAGDNVCHSQKAAEEIAKRGYFVKDAQQAKLYLRLAQVIQGEMKTPEMLEKVANSLDLMDRLNGMDRHYGSAFEDPYKTVYNMTVKAAEASIDVMDILGHQYTLDELQGVGPELYKTALGDGFLSAISASGQLSKEAMKSVIPTLPRDEKAILVKHLDEAIEKEPEDAELLRSVSGR